VLLDAGRSEVFLGAYDVRNGRAAMLHEALLTYDELLKRMQDEKPEMLVTPDAALESLLKQESIASRLLERPTSETIARLGIGKIKHGETVSVDELDANYIRRSDAEIFSLPKLRR
jgi:tRNA threonylcarbamoyladenosine biosynthesis protein TsaB